MDPFKTCPLCGHAWASRRQFLEDPELELIGYQVDFLDVALGLFLFNHRDCETTLAVRAGNFLDLYDGPVYQGCRAGEAECLRHCLRRSDLRPCPVECECACVRALLGIIRAWPRPKRSPAAPVEGR